MSAHRPVSQGTTIDAETCSLKRLAWTYGCAPKGSPEEQQLGVLLLERVSAELVELGATWAAIAFEAIVESERLRALIDHPELVSGDRI